MSYEGKRAIVVGAGMAGLLAARALHGSFDEVVLIERDALPDSPVERQAVPQSRHIHLLLARGADLLEAFFPGILAKLVEAGAVRYDSSRDFRWYQGGLWKNRFESGIHIHGMSRALLEWTVRARVTAMSGMRVVSPANATRPLATADSVRVTGVEIEREGALEPLEADLVVDASGRGARAPRWLEALGYGAPPETVVKAGLAYTSAVFRMPERRPDWKLLIQASPPVAFRNGLIGCIEGDQWIVSPTCTWRCRAPSG
jgi:flavin-dependent dehydrogenase